MEKGVAEVRRTKQVILRSFEEKKGIEKVPYLDIEGLNRKLSGISLLEQIRSSKRGVEKTKDSLEANNLNISNPSSLKIAFLLDFCLHNNDLQNRHLFNKKNT